MQEILTRFGFRGIPPADSVPLVAACIELFANDEAPEVKTCFGFHLVQALDLLRRQQSCEWLT